MRRMKTRVLGLFMAVIIFLSPLLTLADVICRCPDCARRVCAVMPAACACQDDSEASPSCCSRNVVDSQACELELDSGPDTDSAHPRHPSAPESQGCNCNGYFYTHGSAVLPMGGTNTLSITEEFYQPLPTTLITSGWVYQILHPPRLYTS